MSHILNELKEIVYISDLETYELKFINTAGLEALGIEKYKSGTKCYELITNSKTPCKECPVKNLKEKETYCWEIKNEYLQRTYSLHDRLIEWEGKNCHIQLAKDITDKKKELEELKITEKTERTIIKCLELLHEDKSLKTNFISLLSEICSYVNADRTFIYKINNEEQVLELREEYTKSKKITKSVLNDSSLTPIQDWLKKMKKGQIIYITDINSIPKLKSEYSYMKYLNNESIILAPILSNSNKLIGFIGADNPSINVPKNIVEMLFKTLTHFLAAIIERYNINKDLEFLSYHDSLTKLQNRNKFNLDLDNNKKAKLSDVGIAFIDMNGLKRLNDTKGHTEGDKALTQIANIILSAFKEEYTYRIGGDEFVVIYPNIKKITFMQGISKLQAFSADKTKPSIAIGYNWFEQITNLEKILNEVDSLMYDDKNRYYNHYRATHSI